MKMLAILLFLLSFHTFAQQTLILKPGPSEGKDNHIDNQNIYNVWSTREIFFAYAENDNGQNKISRSFIRFDLDQIPPGSNIISAYLKLYSVSSLWQGGGHSKESGSNKAALYRVTENWEVNSLTWNSQPSVSTTDKVILEESTSSTQDYEVDVTTMIKHMYLNDNYGMMLRLDSESYKRGLVFASSNHEEASKWPELTITYSSTASVDEAKQDFITIFPNPAVDAIYISGTSTAGEYEIFDNLSRSVKKGHLKDHEKIGVQDLKTGVYYLKINSKTFLFSKL